MWYIQLDPTFMCAFVAIFKGYHTIFILWVRQISINSSKIISYPNFMINFKDLKTTIY